MIARSYRVILALFFMAFLIHLLTACDGSRNSNVQTIGNVTFTDVQMAGDATAGYESDVTVRICSETVKYNVLVRLKLTSSVAEDSAGGEEESGEEYGVWQTVVDTIEAGETVTVNESFLMPLDVPPGTYYGVFSLNEEDYFPDDDDQQGEADADLADNEVVADARITVAATDLAGLEIYRSDLANYSFVQNPAGPLSLRADNGVGVEDYPDFTLNQEFAAWAHPLTEPLEVSYALELPDGSSYPLQILSYDGNGDATLVDSITLEPTCRDAQGAPAEAGDDGAACATLFTGSPRGLQVNLYYPDEIYLALGDADFNATLITTLDTDQTVEVISGENGQPVLSQTVAYLADTATSSDTIQLASDRNGSVETAADTARTKHTPLFFSYPMFYGNGNFQIGLDLLAEVNYWKTDLFGMNVPVRGAFEFSGEVPTTLFGYPFQMFYAGLTSDFDIDDISRGYLKFEIYTLGYLLWDAGGNLIGGNQEADTIILVQTIDPSTGDERFSMDQKLELPVEISLYGIPIMTFNFYVKGEIGISGEAGIEPSNVLYASLMPYVDLWAGVRWNPGSANMALAVGVGAEVRAIKVGQEVKPYIQLLPSVPSAKIGVDFPLILKTLDGRLYFWWEYGNKEGDFTIFEWEGLTYEFELIPSVSKIWNMDDDQAVLFSANGHYYDEGRPYAPDPHVAIGENVDLWVSMSEYRYNYIQNDDQIAFAPVAYPTKFLTATNGGGSTLVFKNAGGSDGNPGRNQWFTLKRTYYRTFEGQTARAYRLITRTGNLLYAGAYGGESVDATGTAYGPLGLVYTPNDGTICQEMASAASTPNNYCMWNLFKIKKYDAD